MSTKLPAMLTKALKSFPEIEERDGRYYLFLGVLTGLNAREIIEVLESILSGEILRRKIIIARLPVLAEKWSKQEVSQVFEEIFRLIDTVDTYHKKESASLAMMSICSFLSEKDRRKILSFFLTSDYTNNRKRAYSYLLEHWSKDYEPLVIGALQTYGDAEAVNVLVRHGAKKFLVEHLDELIEFFPDEDIEYDFWLRISRNKFFARIADEIPKILKKLKKDEPISYISIMKDSGGKIDPKWALEVLKKNAGTRYLPRWYGEMDLWKELIKLDPAILE